MSVKNYVDTRFGIFFLLSIVAGFTLSGILKNLECAVIYLLMAILIFIFLKIDIIDIIHQLKRPWLLTYILSMNLVVLPVIVYFISLPLTRELLVALVLIAALPTAVSAPALTDIVKGKSSLTLVISVLSTFLSAITLPLVLYILLKTKIELDYIDLFQTVSLLIFIPLLISHFIKRFSSKKHVGLLRDYSNTIIVILISLIIAIVIGIQADYIMSNPAEIFYYLIVLYPAFFAFQLFAYFMVNWLKKDEKVAVSNSKTFMNTGLGIALAITFFDPKVALILVLSEFPWSTMLIIFNMYKKYLP